MARYKLNRGPRYGETIHLPNTQEVALALALGDIELVTDPQQVAADNNFAPPVKPITEPQWAIGYNRLGSGPSLSLGVPCITLRLPSGDTCFYGGDPEKAKDGFKRRIWSGATQDYIFDGPEPPDAIVDEYKALKAAALKRAQPAG